MSTITSPREPSVNGRRPLIPTPTSSRPSSENPRSSDPSPNRASLSSSQAPLPKRNRAALREYYNLKASAAAGAGATASSGTNNADDAASITSSIHDNNSLSEVIESVLDSPDFDAQAYTKNALERQSLGELLRTYNGVLTDIRALDAEKKALVYDNYSKLIKATETIRKMRDNMDPLNPMAGTLDLAVRGVYERADALREELRRELGATEGGGAVVVGVEEMKRREERRKARVVVERVLGTPERVRKLVEEGKEEEARTLWDSTAALLEKWKMRGVGGGDVQECIDDGEAALRGEPPSEKSWTKLKREVKS